MAKRAFSAGLRAHRNTAAEIKKDDQGQKKKQDFLRHAMLKAEAVRGSGGSPSHAALRQSISGHILDALAGA